jgi:ABC-type nickel/cobalt efflux system permease component RcnA
MNWTRFLLNTVLGLAVALVVLMVGLFVEPSRSTALATWALVLTALIAAWVAVHQLKAVRRSHEEEMRPYVVLDFSTPPEVPTVIDLVATNIGRTVARDVTFVFTPPLRASYDETDYPVSSVRWIAEGIRMMPPGREYRTIFDSAIQLEDSDVPRRYDVKVKYADSAGRRHEHDEHLQVDLQTNSTYVARLGMHEAVAALRNIDKQITARFGELRVAERRAPSPERDNPPPTS